MNQDNNLNTGVNNEVPSMQPINPVSQDNNLNAEINKESPVIISDNTNTNSSLPNQSFDDLGSVNSNSKPSKKKNFLLLSIIIAVVGAGLVFVGVQFSQDKTNNSGNSTENENSGVGNTSLESNIKQISMYNFEISGTGIAALTNDNDLYYISDNNTTLKKVASNADDFSLNSYVFYYTDKDGKVYSLDSKLNPNLLEDVNDVKKIHANSNFCIYTLNNSNELLVKNGYYGKEYCGLDIQYQEFTKLADNVKEIFADNDFGAYITNNNELYLSASNSNFEKLMDNVKSIYSASMFATFIITNDNELYYYYNNTQDNKSYTLTLLKDDVVEIGDYHFKTTDGTYYVYDYKDGFEFTDGETQIMEYSEYGKIYYAPLADKDIKQILYYHDGKSFNYDTMEDEERNKLIYISIDNKLVLKDKSATEKLDNNTDNLTKLFDFCMTNSPLKK